MERILDGGIIRFFEAGKAEGRSRPDPLSRGALRLYLRKWFSCLKSRSQKWSSHLGMFAKTKKREDCIPQSVAHRAKRTHFDTFRKQSLQKIKKCSPCSSYFFLLLPPKFSAGEEQKLFYKWKGGHFLNCGNLCCFGRHYLGAAALQFAAAF